MRQETVEYTIYKYDELSEEAKDKVIEKFIDINVDLEWWDCSYDDFKEDLAEIGLECDTFYFSLNRDSHIEASKLRLIDDEKFVRSFNKDIKDSLISAAELCLEHHTGRHSWDTFTSNYDVPDRCPRLQKAVFSLIDACNEKLKDLLETFLSRLQRECDYLTSREAIEETILCNEYEFLEHGEMYR